MKISDAQIRVTAHNFSEQMDLMLKEESRTHITGTAPTSSNNRFISVGGGTNSFPVMVVDRVSLSQTKQVEYQSGYSGEISSRSAVRSSDTGEIKVFEQKELVETLVGGVIDRAVVARQLHHIRTWQEQVILTDPLVISLDGGLPKLSDTGFDMTAPDNTLQGRLKSSGIFLFENGNVGSIQQIDLAVRPIENEKKEAGQDRYA